MKVIFVIVIFASLASQAGAGVTIERIEESALDNLIQAKDNRLAITFMAAWCGPCIDELPILNKLYLKYNEKGLNLIGVSIDLEGPKAMQPIVDKLKINFPIYWYGEKAINKFKLNAIPMLFFVKHGEIVEKLYGRRSKRSLDKKIDGTWTTS